MSQQGQHNGRVVQVIGPAVDIEFADGCVNATAQSVRNVGEAAPPAPDLLALRQFLRSGGLAALEALGAALFIYCLLFQRKMARRAA